jgi:hypothetical protein
MSKPPDKAERPPGIGLPGASHNRPWPYNL